MRTKNFKTLNGWLNYVANRGNRNERFYETLQDFCKSNWRFSYFKNFGESTEWHISELVSVPWEQKYSIVKEIVDFHWRNRTKADRERIATALAKGDGDLNYLRHFQLEMRKKNGRWEYSYCTSSLSGPNYDYCKRKYLQSI